MTAVDSPSPDEIESRLSQDGSTTPGSTTAPGTGWRTTPDSNNSTRTDGLLFLNPSSGADESDADTIDNSSPCNITRRQWHYHPSKPKWWHTATPGTTDGYISWQYDSTWRRYWQRYWWRRLLAPPTRAGSESPRWRHTVESAVTEDCLPRYWIAYTLVWAITLKLKLLLKRSQLKDSTTPSFYLKMN